MLLIFWQKEDHFVSIYTVVLLPVFLAYAVKNSKCIQQIGHVFSLVDHGNNEKDMYILGYKTGTCTTNIIIFHLTNGLWQRL